MKNYEKRWKVHEEEMKKGNFFRQAYFRLFTDDTCRGKMRFPAHMVMVGEDRCLVYDIPDECMQEALDRANPLKGHVEYPVGKKKRVPFTDKPIPFKDAIIVYYKRQNWIVPPMFFLDGTTAIGWGIQIYGKYEKKPLRVVSVY